MNADAHERLEQERRAREGRIGELFAAGWPRCMSASPETGTPCRLPDVEEVHRLGHHGWDGPSSSVGWGITYEEQARWVAQ